MYEELDVHNKVQECANRLVELKKQKRGVDKSIARVEKGLSDLFDVQNVVEFHIPLTINYCLSIQTELMYQ